MNQAKFQIPSTAQILIRERLMEKLLDWETRKLIIIHAHAGQGKSTLAAGYARSLKSPLVWYTMDRDDENPDLFLSSLAHAVHRAWPKQVPSAPRLPGGMSARSSGPQTLGPWFDHLFGNLPKDSLIILDEYHTIPSSSMIHILMQSLLDRTQLPVRFMIISRTQPDLDLTKLRAARALGEMTGNDLRFTDDEVQDLFSLVFHLHISPSEAALINATTEGWPAGLVLMHSYLTSLEPRERALALIDRKSVAFRTHVFDYLAQEVFSRLPGDIQRFLLLTSITDHLPDGLIPLLTELPSTGPSRKPSVASMVQELRKRNLFITAAGGPGEAVRYHSLFREFLRKKLYAQTGPREIKRLHTIAADYFKQGGDLVRSIDLTLASGQFDLAARQIESCGEQLITRGQTQTLVRWIEALPLEHADRPWFLLYRAVACRYTDPRAALSFFDLAYKGFTSRANTPRKTVGKILSLCGIIEECFHSGGDFKRMGKAALLAQMLLDRSKGQTPEIRARLWMALGMAWFFIGRLEPASDALSRALDLFRKQKDHFHLITTALYLTPCALYEGDFRLARETVRTGFEALSGIPDDAGSRAALFLVKGMTALFEGDLIGAQECIGQCRGLADSNALESIGLLSLSIGGWLKIAQGELRDAEQMLAECRRRGESSKNAFFSASAAHLLAITHMFQSDFDKAQKESDYALSIRTQSGSKLFHGIYLLADGAIRMKRGKYTEAAAITRKALVMLQHIKAMQQVANAHLVLAQLYLRQHKESAAYEHLGEAFSLGQSRGFTYYALLTTAELVDLAKTALSHTLCTSYCSDLLDVLSSPRGMPRIRIFCLGGFRVMIGNTPIRDAAWKSSIAKQLIKLLIAHEGNRIPREMLMDMLWPKAPQDVKRLNLNSVLHRIRNMLDGEDRSGSGQCIMLKDDSMHLNARLVWTDAGQFSTHLKTAEQNRHGHRPAAALQEYDKALALYLGDFLPDDLYDEGLADAREHLRAGHIKALEEAARIAEATGDRDMTLRYFDRMFLADPCNEKACCWLMLRYQSDGKRNEAIRTYERCERALAQNMDMEPDEKTKKVYRSIIGG